MPEGHAVATLRVAPFDCLVAASDVASAALEAVVVDEQHFAVHDIKQIGRANVDASGGVAGFADFGIQRNMRLFVNVEPHGVYLLLNDYFCAADALAVPFAALDGFTAQFMTVSFDEIANQIYHSSDLPPS